MADQLIVDLAVLESIADRLSRAGDALGAVSAAAPGTVDGGEATPLLTALISRHRADVDGLSGGLRQVGAQIFEASQAYATTDVTSGHWIGEVN